MTNYPCTYCGEHHRYEHELVCDNVRSMYPLLPPNYHEKKEALQVTENRFIEEIKFLRNEIIFLSTSRHDAIKSANHAISEKVLLEQDLKKLKGELYRLKNPGKTYTINRQD